MPVLTELVRLAVEVIEAGRVRIDADLTATDLTSIAFSVSAALTDELALEVQATLARATLIIKATPEVRDTEPELAKLAKRAVGVIRAIGRRKRQTRPRDTLETKGALIV